MMNDISMLFCTCDSYSETWNPFFKLLKKYWPDYNYPVYFNSESATYSFEDLIIKCPFAKSRQKTRQKTPWSKRLLNILKYVDTEFVFMILDDYWLTDYVDSNQFNNCLDIMRANKKVGYICLTGYKTTMLNDGTGRVISSEYDGILEATSKCPYRVHAQAGLWRTQYLKKLLKGYEDAWRFEPMATIRSKFFSYRCFDVVNPIIKYPFGGIIWGGRVKEEYFNMYPSELITPLLDKREILKIGEKYTPIFGNRPIWQKIYSRFPSIKIK